MTVLMLYLIFIRLAGWMALLARTHQLQAPRPDHPAVDLSQERIKRRPVLGGLINEYEQAA